ncbi:DEAD/DEAH box helicase [Microbacterium sp. 77mftsu3.1]|uniref:SNF2-related protein n=1 Tax=Microbacterium sp. 77mftsu3.1 TaxID=1761802 RepID=UPI00035CD2E9|nr:DEAD/DEAH box helicase [Microbacterium sp. 77mftsu3.1]SDH53486.1 SNF2 family N-terminal domain-containing protein [Microbacterium sp. 77mftsu3.1]
MTRTYGKLTFRNNSAGGNWYITAEPAVVMRFKRTFCRVQQNRDGTLWLRHTIEVARDLDWFTERFPLEMDEKTRTRLTGGADAHRDQEQTVADILARKTPAPLTLAQEPAVPARDYQLTAVELLRARGALLLTDSVGLGKTYTGLLATAPEDARPALVVPPTHLPKRWMDEWAKSFPHLNVVVGEKTTPPDTIVDGDLPDVLIVPYSRLAGWADALAGRVKTVIFDEVQELRNGTNTRKGQAAAMVAEKATYVMGMSATPIQNYGDEIHSICDIVAPGELGTRSEFIREWCTAGHRVLVRDPAVLGSYLRENGLLLGRTRKDVGRELPTAIKVPHIVESDPAALAAVQEDVAELARLILSDSASRQDRFQAAGEIDWKLRQSTGIAKAPYVAAFVRMLLETETKVLLFGWHRDVYEIWMDLLSEYNPVMYSGSETPAQKAAAEERFASDPTCRIMVMSLRSGAGVDGLQNHARVVVFGELDWSPKVHDQGIGRLERDGMDENDPVLAYFLHTVDGSDPAVLERLDLKMQQSDPIVNPDAALTAPTAPDPDRARSLARAFLDAAAARAA